MGRRLDAFQRVLEGAVARKAPPLMGVCNVTPDSFSDGGRYLGADAARARVDGLLAAGPAYGAGGGASPPPGPTRVPAREQLARVPGGVEYAVERGACVSNDTTSPEVAAACLG